MKISKSALETAAAVIVTAAAAVQSVLVAKGLESADDAAVISSGLAILLGGYHGGAVAVTQARTAPAPAVTQAPPPQVASVDVTAAPDGSVLS